MVSREGACIHALPDPWRTGSLRRTQASACAPQLAQHPCASHRSPVLITACCLWLPTSQVVGGAEPGVEYDGDSEDELTTIASLGALPGAAGRFKLLHELWASGVPRARPSPASSVHGGVVGGMVPLPH